MNLPVSGERGRRRRRHVVFSLVFALLLLLVGIVALEILLPRIAGKWWSSIDLVGHPDHRMTTEQYKDVNADGVRCARQPEEFREEDFNIVVLGDSFVYGMWLGRQDTAPYRLEQRLRDEGLGNVHVVNFGWISASPYLSLRLLRDIGHKYKPDLVVSVVDMTDFWDDTFYRNAVERRGFFTVARWIPATSLFLGKWGREVVQADWYSQALWGVPWQRYFPMERPLDQTRPYLDTVVGNLDETERYVREVLHARYAVFVLPRSVQYSERETPHDPSDEYSRLGPHSLEPFRYFADIAPLRPYPVVSLLEDFRASPVFPLTMDRDPHHTSAGNKEQARFMHQHLRRLGLLPEPVVDTTSR